MQASAMDVWQMLTFPLSLYSPRISLPDRRTGQHCSSDSNLFFGSLQDLTLWSNLTDQLTTISTRIPPSVAFFGIHPDTTYDLTLEADVIRAAHVYLVHPVNVILKKVYPESNIRCMSEMSERRAYSRLDIHWRYNDVAFAILEFKRPYSIRYLEWERAMTGTGRVLRDGGRIARQLKKYGYYFSTPYVGVFDWLTLVALKLEGPMAEWKVDEGAIPPATPATYAWVEQDGAMRMALLCFLMEALHWRCQGSPSLGLL
ncbi:hypothetical protein V1525DRAFT_284897 [Lipomyces kononenkoae]|uniref:Uncharacterized protein n=1 Tax=Lipomyces kononenkoae TaxID=34357 RepID=A0ACC3SU26_LIPKO